MTDTQEYTVFKNDDGGRASAKKLLRLAQDRIGRLSREDYHNLWVFITSQTASYSAEDKIAVLKSVGSFFEKMQKVFPSLRINNNLRPLFGADPGEALRESIVLMFREIQENLGM